MDSELIYLNRLKERIAEQTQLGNENGVLRQRDFMYLAELIEEESRIRLSISTLKRIWKPDNQSLPHLSTLDALVQVVGYPNWHEYKKTFSSKRLAQSKQPKSVSKGIWYFATIGFLGLMVLLALVVPGFISQEGVYIKGRVDFTADQTVSVGVPNSVIFAYDVSNVMADSFFIQQSWNEAFREAIDPNKTHFTSIYYYPGYHKAKLIANDSIIAEQPIHLLTDGWLAFVNTGFGQERPIYLSQELGSRSGHLRIERADLKAVELNLQQPFKVSFRQMQDFGNLSSQDFRLKARLKADPIPEVPCPVMELTLHCEQHIMVVPITSKGCVSSIGLKLSDKYLRGKEHDFSDFGVENLAAWHELELQVKDQKARVFIDGRLIYQLDEPANLGLIKGLDIRIVGLGQADWIKMWDGKDQLVFSDEFE
ncbi:MAG: hypothetical protein AAF927_13035 [Bacteroidota bacterium]